jgi:tetratricopeptide (TPR) repeat protein
VWLLAALLALVTIGLYWPATSHDFVNYDDNLYVTENPHVQGGLSWEGIKWAFVNPVNSNWHPLTVLSHMLDCQLFGLNPWGHHLTSVLLHALNTVLVFVLLQRLTGALWRSALVAALFGLHPLHVESVAWVAERKDVLSTCFGLLMLLFYARYVQKAENGKLKAESGGRFPSSIFHPLSSSSYWLALLFFALGLMSKAMVVTWPFVLLLLDWWPLQRVSSFKFSVSSPGLMPPSTLNSQLPGATKRSEGGSTLLLEKLPFFGLAVVMSVVTFVVQKQTGALAAVKKLPLGARCGNALISYCRYLGKLFWPADLAVFYPHPGYWPMEQVVLAGGLLLGITVWFIMVRRRYPYLLMGWLWYCGTLVPVIQLVQSGSHAMADRYTYIPSLGVLILAIWGAYELTRRWRYQMTMLSVAGCAAIVLSLGLTRHQLGYWRDSETLFRHAVAVTENNHLAHNNLGFTLGRKDQFDEAISQFQEAIRLKPDYAEAHNNLGFVLDKKDQTDEAIHQFQEAIRLEPDYAKAHNNLGIAFGRQRQTDEAISQFQEAIRLEPDYSEAHYDLGIALGQKGQTDEAISQYQEAIRLKPDFAEAHVNLAKLLAVRGRLNEAVSHYRTVIGLKPDSADARGNLANVLAAQGKLDEAVKEYQQTLALVPNSVQAHFRYGRTLQEQHHYGAAMTEYQRALELKPENWPVSINLAWVLATCPEASLRNGQKAVELAQQAEQLSGGISPEILDTLAAAFAEAGRYPEAVETVRQALSLPATQNNQPLADAIQTRLKLYETHSPYREKL